MVRSIPRPRAHVLCAVFLTLGCGESSFIPGVVSSASQANLGADRFWEGVALIHSADFNDPDLIDRIIAEVQRLNSVQDGPPCNWWRRIVEEEDATNCSWQTISVFAGDIQLDTYLADSITIVAILPDSTGDWQITLTMNGRSSDLGSVRSYGFTDVKDGPGISNETLDWPGKGAGKILGMIDAGSLAMLRHLDVRTANYEDLDLGVIYGWPRAPGRTWDSTMIAFTSFPPGVEPYVPVTFWRLLPTPEPVVFGEVCEKERWYFIVATSPTECVTNSNKHSAFLTDSSEVHYGLEHRAAWGGVEYSVKGRRWIRLPWNEVHDFAGTQIFGIPNLEIGAASLTAAEFSAGGETLFAAGHSSSSDSLWWRVVQSIDAQSGVVNEIRYVGLGGPHGRINDLLVDPASPWLYLMRGCPPRRYSPVAPYEARVDSLRPQLEVLDRENLQSIRRIDLGIEDQQFLCSDGNLVLSRDGENAIYMVFSEGRSGNRSRIFRFEIPPPNRS